MSISRELVWRIDSVRVFSSKVYPSRCKSLRRAIGLPPAFTESGTKFKRSTSVESTSKVEYVTLPAPYAIFVTTEREPSRCDSSAGAHSGTAQKASIILRGPSANSSVNHHWLLKGAWAAAGSPWKYVTQL